MSMQILDIVIYSHDSQRRILSLRPGQVNIITGASKTGKSALVDKTTALVRANVEFPRGRFDAPYLGSGSDSN